MFYNSWSKTRKKYDYSPLSYSNYRSLPWTIQSYVNLSYDRLWNNIQWKYETIMSIIMDM